MSGTKKRFGFVSNSSSSSFLIYGTYVNSDQVKEFEERTGKDIESLEEEFSMYSMEYSDGYYIGESWSSVGDNRTGKQFKESIEKSLSEHFPDAKFCTHQEAWYNG